MRLKYFGIVLFIITSLSLIYAWQQIKIIQLAYDASHKSMTYKELLDKNHSLRYNLVSLKSSSNLGMRLLSDDTEYEIPTSSQMMVLNLPKTKSTTKAQAVFGRDGIFLRVSEIKDSWPLTLVKSYFNR